MLIEIILLGVFGVLGWLFLLPRRNPNLPPGPPRKPILGNIGYTKTKGAARIYNTIEMVKRYGDGGLCTFYMASRPVVFITDYELIKKVLHDDNFAGRPVGIRDRFFKRKGLIFTDGELWKEHRRFALSTLRDLGMGKNWVQDLIIDEAKALVDDIRTSGKEVIDPAPFLTTSVSNVICAIAYGKRFDHKDPKFRRLTSLIGENVALAADSTVAEFFPFLVKIPFTKIKKNFTKLQQNFREVASFLGALVTEHQKNFQSGDRTDYIHAYMTEAEKQKGNSSTTFTSDQLEMSILNLFGAGTETTSTTIYWALLYLLQNPEVYKKCQAEVDSVVPDGGFPNLEEKEDLPYVQATIMEVQRLANLVPMVPRCNIETCKLGKYTIPAGTTVIPIINAVHMDEKCFPEPEKFKPERHLDASGKLKKSEHLIPFSVGKRYCVGEALARMELYIFFATLLKHFTVSLPPGHTVNLTDSIFNIVHAPRRYEIRIEPR